MDCLPTFYCDGSVVTFPKAFRVRKYDNALNYSVHNVLRYHTKNSRAFVYCMMRSPEKVTVRVSDSDIIAQNDRLSNYKYMHFPVDTPISNIVCEMLTKKHSLVVLEDTNIIDTPLF